MKVLFLNQLFEQLKSKILKNPLEKIKKFKNNYFRNIEELSFCQFIVTNREVIKTGVAILLYRTTAPENVTV